MIPIRPVLVDGFPIASCVRNWVIPTPAPANQESGWQKQSLDAQHKTQSITEIHFINAYQNFLVFVIVAVWLGTAVHRLIL